MSSLWRFKPTVAIIGKRPTEDRVSHLELYPEAVFGNPDFQEGIGVVGTSAAYFKEKQGLSTDVPCQPIGLDFKVHQRIPQAVSYNV